MYIIIIYNDTIQTISICEHLILEIYNFFHFNKGKRQH